MKKLRLREVERSAEDFINNAILSPNLSSVLHSGVAALGTSYPEFTQEVRLASAKLLNMLWFDSLHRKGQVNQETQILIWVVTLKDNGILGKSLFLKNSIVIGSHYLCRFFNESFFKTLKFSISSLPPSLPIFSRDISHCKAIHLHDGFPFVCLFYFVLFGFVSGLPYPRLIPGRLPARTEISILPSFLETCYSPKLWSSLSGCLKTVSGFWYDQHYFYNYTQIFTFPSLILSQVHSRVFQRLSGMWHHSRLSAETDMRIQVSSRKSSIKGICNHVKQCH